MLDVKSIFKRVSKKLCVKANYNNNDDVRNFIIIPKGTVIMSAENSGLSHKEILKKIMFTNEFIQNAIMNYPCGYYSDGKIFFFQGDLSNPETVKPITSSNLSLIKSKFVEIKKMLKCNDNVSVYFHARVEKVKDIFNHLANLKTKYLLQRTK